MTQCPICDRDANQIPPTGDADIFDCPSHGVFKVAGTLTALPKFKWASIPDWERALRAARAREARRLAADKAGRPYSFAITASGSIAATAEAA